MASVSTAFLNRQLILAFDETAHDRNYIPATHIFQKDQAPQLIETPQALLTHSDGLEAELRHQEEYALAESPNSFLQL